MKHLRIRSSDASAVYCLHLATVNALLADLPRLESLRFAGIYGASMLPLPHKISIHQRLRTVCNKWVCRSCTAILAFLPGLEELDSGETE